MYAFLLRMISLTLKFLSNMFSFVCFSYYRHDFIPSLKDHGPIHLNIATVSEPGHIEYYNITSKLYFHYMFSGERSI